MRIVAHLLLPLGCLIAVPAHGEVTDSSASGFAVDLAADVAAPPEAVWDMLVRPQRWWLGAHSYSGDAANLTLEAHAGGCWCEALKDGGSVEHMRVVSAMPARLLRLSGLLGPLQAMGGSGALTIALEPRGAGTHIRVTYVVGGFAPGGYGVYAAPVNQVLGDQLANLRKIVESAHPE